MMTQTRIITMITLWMILGKIVILMETLLIRRLLNTIKIEVRLLLKYADWKKMCSNRVQKEFAQYVLSNGNKKMNSRLCHVLTNSIQSVLRTGCKKRINALAAIRQYFKSKTNEKYLLNIIRSWQESQCPVDNYNFLMFYHLSFIFHYRIILCWLWLAIISKLLQQTLQFIFQLMPVS